MDIKEKIQAVLDGIFATEMLDGEVSRENIVEGCLFHKWVSVSPPVSGMMKRGVTGHRRCAKCGMEQIRKPESGSGWHVSKKADK